MTLAQSMELIQVLPDIYMTLCICWLTLANSGNLGFQIMVSNPWLVESENSELAHIEDQFYQLFCMRTCASVDLGIHGDPGATSLWISWDDYTCIPVCVWCLLTHVLSCGHPPKADIWLSLLRSSLMLPLHTLPNSWQSLICSHCYNFVISQLLYK